MMKIAEAFKIAEKSKEVKELESRGFFLNSGMAFLEPTAKETEVWNLTFYHPSSNEVAQVIVNDGVSVKEIGTPINPTREALNLKEVKTTNDKMLAKASKEFQKYKQKASQIILSLQCESGEPIWRVNYITTLLYLITVKLDAKTGKVLSSEISSISR